MTLKFQSCEIMFGSFQTSVMVFDRVICMATGQRHGANHNHMHTFMYMIQFMPMKSICKAFLSLQYTWWNRTHDHVVGSKLLSCIAKKVACQDVCFTIIFTLSLIPSCALFPEEKHFISCCSCSLNWQKQGALVFHRILSVTSCVMLNQPLEL